MRRRSFRRGQRSSTTSHWAMFCWQQRWRASAAPMRRGTPCRPIFSPELRATHHGSQPTPTRPTAIIFSAACGSPAWTSPRWRSLVLPAYSCRQRIGRIAALHEKRDSAVRLPNGQLGIVRGRPAESDGLGRLLPERIVDDPAEGLLHAARQVVEISLKGLGGIVFADQLAGVEPVLGREIFRPLCSGLDVVAIEPFIETAKSFFMLWHLIPPRSKSNRYREISGEGVRSDDIVTS